MLSRHARWRLNKKPIKCPHNSLKCDHEKLQEMEHIYQQRSSESQCEVFFSSSSTINVPVSKDNKWQFCVSFVANLLYICHGNSKAVLASLNQYLTFTFGKSFFPHLNLAVIYLSKTKWKCFILCFLLFSFFFEVPWTHN